MTGKRLLTDGVPSGSGCWYATNLELLLSDIGTAERHHLPTIDYANELGVAVELFDEAPQVVETPGQANPSPAVLESHLGPDDSSKPGKLYSIVCARIKQKVSATDQARIDKIVIYIHFDDRDPYAIAAPRITHEIAGKVYDVSTQYDRLQYAKDGGQFYEWSWSADKNRVDISGRFYLVPTQEIGRHCSEAPGWYYTEASAGYENTWPFETRILRDITALCKWSQVASID